MRSSPRGAPRAAIVTEIVTESGSGRGVGTMIQSLLDGASVTRTSLPREVSLQGAMKILGVGVAPLTLMKTVNPSMPPAGERSPAGMRTRDPDDTMMATPPKSRDGRPEMTTGAAIRARMSDHAEIEMMIDVAAGTTTMTTTTEDVTTAAADVLVREAAETSTTCSRKARRDGPPWSRSRSRCSLSWPRTI